MSRRLLIDRSPGETRVALVEDATLVDYEVTRDHDPPRLGALYQARIRKKYGGRQAFAELGDGDALIDLLEPGSGAPPFEEGRLHPVQITQDARRGRLARGTTRIAIAGPRLVLLPAGRKISVSRRLADKRVAARVGAVVERGDAGLIVRARAVGSSDEDLRREHASLAAVWAAAQAAAAEAQAPGPLVAPAAPGVGQLRHAIDPARDSVRVGHTLDFERLVAYCRAFGLGGETLVALTPEGVADGFDEIEDQIDAALSRRVALPGGGSIVLDETEALTAVDVDAGSDRAPGAGAARSINLRAVPVIARQLRVRALGGLVAVDLAGAPEANALDRIRQAFQAAFDDDPMRVEIEAAARFGLVLISRQWSRRPLSDIVASAPAASRAGVVESPESVALRGLRLASRNAGRARGGELVLHLAPSAEQALASPGLAPAIDAVERETRLRLRLVVHAGWPPDRVEFEAG